MNRLSQTIWALVLCLMLGGQVAVAADQKAVLATGASSGIGLKITEYLSDAGYFVYAGALVTAEGAGCAGSGPVEP